MASTRETASISPADFEHLQRVVQERCGLQLDLSKKDLIFLRLKKRLKIERSSELRDYCDRLLKAGGGVALQQLIDEVTTQHTKFFRENTQLEYLRQQLLPDIQQRGRAGAEKKLRVWSAGCSSGEEPYSLAMILAETLGTAWDIRILASDICHAALHKAEQGCYPASDLADVPTNWAMKYFDRTRVDGLPCLRVKKPLREMIDFRQINFMEARYPINTLFEIIFCRNVIIYFDQVNRDRLLRRFADYLQGDNGYLFLGHSEIITGIPTLQKRKLNVFQKMGV